MTYDNIKNHKKPGLNLHSSRYIFWKKHKEVQNEIPPLSVLTDERN